MSRLWVHAEAFDVGTSLVLSADESRHVSARRARVGDDLVVFDGAGRIGEARVETLGRRGVVVGIERVREVERSADRFVLASAIPKAERLAVLLPMLTQIGVENWQPLVLFDSAQRELDVESARMRRILVESAKLARRAWLLELRAPIGLDELLAAHAGRAGRIAFGEREGEHFGIPARAELAVVGPEAGFTPGELRRLRAAGGVGCRLSEHNLRIETAAIAAAATHFAARGVEDRVDGRDDVRGVVQDGVRGESRGRVQDASADS